MTVPGEVIVFLSVLWGFIMLWVIIIQTPVDWSDVTQLYSSRVGKIWWSAPLNHIQRWSRPVPQQICNVNVSWCITSNLKQNKPSHFGHVWKRLHIYLKHLWSQTRLRHIKPDINCNPSQLIESPETNVSNQSKLALSRYCFCVSWSLNQLKKNHVIS